MLPLLKFHWKKWIYVQLVSQDCVSMFKKYKSNPFASYLKSRKYNLSKCIYINHFLTPPTSPSRERATEQSEVPFGFSNIPWILRTGRSCQPSSLLLLAGCPRPRPPVTHRGRPHPWVPGLHAGLVAPSQRVKVRSIAWNLVCWAGVLFPGHLCSPPWARAPARFGAAPPATRAAG